MAFESHQVKRNTTESYNAHIVAILWYFSQILKLLIDIRGSFFMFIELGCISTNIKFTVPLVYIFGKV